MIETIPISVKSSTKTHNTSKIITAGDSGAYRLEITWSDLVTIVGSCQLYFVRGDGLGITKDSSDGVVLSGNKVTYLLDESLYAVEGLVCWVQLVNSNLYTVLKIEFSGIRVPEDVGSIPAEYTYPTWVTEAMAALEEAESDRVTAETNRAVWEEFDPLAVYAVGNKVYYLGSSYIMHTVSGVSGTLPTDTDYWAIIAQKGDAGPNTVSTATATDLTGVIAGDGTNIRAATAADGDALPVTGGTLGAQLSAVEDVALSRQLKFWNRPAAYKIKVAAGRFNMLWDNTISTMWVFPAGTVQYSDGITPIRTSTDAKPDVIIPAGGGYVWLVSAMWNGQYTLRSYDTSAILTSALADLPSLTDTLRLDDCSLITGDLADLPPLTYYLSLSGCSQVTGDLADLPPLTNTLNLSNCSQVTGAYTAVNGDNVPKTTILTGTGVSSTDMDATLIAYAACTKTGGTFTATGKTRTTASDAAVLHLTTPTGSGGLGWNVTGLTVV